MTEPVFPTRPRRLRLWLSLRQLALMMMSANSLSYKRGGRSACRFYLGERPLRASFQVPTHLGTGRNPLEVSTKALYKKARV